MGRGGYNGGGPVIAIRPKEDEESDGEIETSGARDDDDIRPQSVPAVSDPHNGDMVIQVQDDAESKHHKNYTGKSGLKANPFLKDLDPTSCAYLSLLRRYERRQNQGRDVQYKGFSKAMSSQSAAEEALCRATVIEFGDDRSDPISFDSSNALRRFLDKDSHLKGKGSPRSTRRLFILEDLAVKYVCLLGSRLRIHPSVSSVQ